MKVLLVRLGILFAVGSGIVVSSACDAFNIPGKDCHGSRVIDSTVSDITVLAEGCAKCVQESCCDAVGRCEAQDGCGTKVINARSCVRKNRPEEAKCIQALEGYSSDVYQCMRRSCGDTCDIPSCDVERSATLLGSPDCDRCVTASCCPEINACYGNRRCKLILECIVTSCREELGDLFTEFGSRGEAAIDASARGACTPFSPDSGPLNLPGGASGCIPRCIDAFATSDGGPYDDIDARCKAFAVYACASSPAHDCGARCRVERTAPPSDASSSDGSSDAAGDAVSDAKSD